MKPSRRLFISTLLAGIATRSSQGVAAALEPRRTKPVDTIVDTHTHFYDPTRSQGVPWPSPDDSVLYRPILPDEFRTLTKPLGVTGTIIVEASPWVEDNQWLLDLAADEPLILGIVGNLSPGTAPFKDQLARFAKNSLYRGIRIGSDALSKGLDQPDFLADLRRLRDADLTLDVNGGPPVLTLVARLAEKMPDLRIVINHLANVRIDGRQPPQEWLDGLKASARNARVYLKVSALIENARVEGADVATGLQHYEAVLNAASEAFGEDRLLYGSNWPVSKIAGPYWVVLRIAQEFFERHGDQAARKFFADNSKAAYRWQPRS